MTDECVYCKSHGPFNAEHVFPAGLGGDDKRYLFTKEVCKRCNDLFSRLETELLQKSPVAIARIALQPSGRFRDGVPTVPSMTAKAVHVLDEQSGQNLESYIDGGMKPRVLPQILIDGKLISGSAETGPEMDTFLAELKKVISADEISLITKLNDRKPAKFKVVTLSRMAGEFVARTTKVLSRPPGQGIWLNEEVDHAGFVPRFYKHKGGGLNYKTTDLRDVFELLKMAYIYLHDPSRSTDWKDATTHQPLVCVESVCDIGMAARAMVKIGFNLLTHAQGIEHAKHHRYDELKSSVLHGSPRVLPGYTDDVNISAGIGDPPAKHHAAMLCSTQMGDGLYVVSFLIKLYGHVHFHILATDTQRVSGEWPVCYLIDYENHRVERVSQTDYFSACHRAIE